MTQRELCNMIDDGILDDFRGLGKRVAMGFGSDPDIMTHAWGEFSAAALEQKERDIKSAVCKILEDVTMYFYTLERVGNSVRGLNSVDLSRFFGEMQSHIYGITERSYDDFDDDDDDYFERFRDPYDDIRSELFVGSDAAFCDGEPVI